MLNLNWDIIYTFINLVVLFILLKIFLFKPVTNMMKKRADIINNDLDSAAESKKEAERLKIEYTDKLKAAEDKANEIVNEATVSAGAERERIISEAEADASGIIERANKQIELDKENSMRGIKVEIAEIALAAAQRVTAKGGSDLNSVDDFISEIDGADESSGGEAGAENE